MLFCRSRKLNSSSYLTEMTIINVCLIYFFLKVETEVSETIVEEKEKQHAQRDHFLLKLHSTSSGRHLNITKQG